MVDEAHHFKNLAIFSKINNVSGISGTGSQKAMDMYLKCLYLDEISDGRGIVFATGTPVSNRHRKLQHIGSLHIRHLTEKGHKLRHIYKLVKTALKPESAALYRQFQCGCYLAKVGGP